MPPVTKKSDGLSLVAYPGDAKTLLAWDLAADQRHGLAGFTVACRPPQGQEYYLWNQLRFEHPEQHEQDTTEPASSSVNAPFHKFRWLHVPGLDHQGLEPAMGTYAYTVTPRYFDAAGKLLALDPELSTAVEVAVGGFEKGSLRLGFTRGYVQSQAYVNHFGKKAVVVRDDADLLYDTSDVAGTNPDGKEFTYADEYAWLGFTARTAVFALLDEVLADKQRKLDFFAYDLDEPDLMKKLLTLAEEGRVRVILDNAALHHDPKDPQPEDKFEARFEEAAKGAAEITRGKFSRYAHDKVMVVSGPAGAEKVLTGSTNFSVSGLYVNSNHVLVFDDEPTARRYADLFQQVWEQEVKTTPFVASPLSAEKFSPDAAAPPRTITFSPHEKEVAAGLLDGIVARVAAEGAKHDETASVLFAVMGLEGSGSVYPALKELHEQDDVFSYGISDDTDGIALYAPGKATGVLVTGRPGGTAMPPPFNQVPGIASYHQIHHKFVICGFNGDDPVVYCGSSNLALAGEMTNGDNLIEINDGDVATAFAIEAVALVDHFQFLDRLKTARGGKRPAPPASKREAAQEAGWFLSTSDQWSQPYFDEQDLHCVDRTLFAAPLSG
jgi:phospholipase D-like protein